MGGLSNYSISSWSRLGSKFDRLGYFEQLKSFWWVCGLFNHIISSWPRLGSKFDQLVYFEQLKSFWWVGGLSNYSISSWPKPSLINVLYQVS